MSNVQMSEGQEENRVRGKVRLCVCESDRERLRVESKERGRNQEQRQSIWEYLSTEGIL